MERWQIWKPLKRMIQGQELIMVSTWNTYLIISEGKTWTLNGYSRMSRMISRNLPQPPFLRGWCQSIEVASVRKCILELIFDKRRLMCYKEHFSGLQDANIFFHLFYKVLPMASLNFKWGSSGMKRIPTVLGFMARWALIDNINNFQHPWVQ